MLSVESRNQPIKYNSWHKFPKTPSALLFKIPPPQQREACSKKKRKKEMRLLASFLVLSVLSLQQCNVGASGGFVRTYGNHFVVNGNQFLANGFNAYWLMYLASDPSQRSKVSAAFSQASSHGLTVARTWAFNDGGSTPLQAYPGSYNEQMFKVQPICCFYFS